MDNHDVPGSGAGAPQGQPLAAGVQPPEPPPAQPATAEQLQEAETKIEERMSGFERSMVRLTTYGLIVTVVTGVIFLGQLYEMISGGTQTDKLVGYAKTQARAASDISQSSEDFTDSAYWMEEHMQDAADAMQDSVDTADQNTKTTIKNAQNAFRQEQRAWVGVENAVFTEFSEGKPVVVTVIFFNSGRTPARNVQSSLRYRLSPVPLSGPAAGDDKQLVFHPVQSIAPQGRFTSLIGPTNVKGEPSTPSQAQGVQDIMSYYPAIKNKTLILYFFGILKYDDAFGGHRQTHFCIYLADPDTKQAGFCDAFNDLN